MAGMNGEPDHDTRTWNFSFVVTGIFFVAFFFGYHWMSRGSTPVEAVLANPMTFVFAVLPLLHGLVGLARGS